ncbi:MAG: diguanylate cyclase [Xanthomonadaceae bacterium]|nr:diguanylate cyclase [Xanthomonadaceae bacterium]
MTRTGFSLATIDQARQTARQFIKQVGILLIALWWAMPQSNGQSEIGNFTHYGVEDGLPQSQVRVIHQDATGYLWVGTQGGLGRFNGREFKRYSSADGLAGNQIGSIVDDQAGRIWVGTNVGVCRLENDFFECAESPLLRGRTVHALAVVQDRLWVGTDRGLIQLRPADMSVVDIGSPEPTSPQLLQQSIRALSYAGNDKLFIGTAAGLTALDLASGEVRSIDLAQGKDPAVVSLHVIGENLWAGGALIYGSYRGLYRMDPDSHGVGHRVPDLEEEIIRSLFLDREGIVWAGHDNGLSKLAPTRFLGYDQNSGLLADFVRALAQDSAGRLWLGTRIGVQVVPLRADGLALDDSLTLTRAEGLPNDRIYAIEFLPGDGFLLATNGGVVHWREGSGVVGGYTTLDGLPSNHVRSLRRDSRGRLWIGTVAGVAFLENGRLITDLAGELSTSYPLNIREDEQGWLWFATRDHGLLLLSPEGATTRLDASDGFSDQTLWDLAPAHGGGMWVGTNGDGLFRIGADGSVAEQFTERDGLANDFVWSVIVDDLGHVWAYTTRGLSRYDGTRLFNYGKSDGLLHLEGGATGALKTQDGRLWFSSVGGLMQFKPRDTATDVAPPPVRIETASVDGTAIQPGERLAHDHSAVTFEYAAFSFQSETGIRYRYRLLGLSEGWQPLGAYRPVTFARLGRGDYEFQVQATNLSGDWSAEPARFAFSVAAPLWLQPWFIVFLALALLMLAVLAWQYRVRSLHRYSARLREQVGKRTTELERANLKLREAATTDLLTGVKNRRFLIEQIGHDISYCIRQGKESIGFLLIDLDGFKKINDGYGHQAGDAVLTEVTQVLIGVARDSDYVIRWGGDEFLVVARHRQADGAYSLADRIMAAFRQTKFSPGSQVKALDCRCSIGVCGFPFVASDPGLIDWEEAVEIADSAVYMAKRNGGDCWVGISATDQTQIDSTAEFLDRLRSAPELVEASGQISIHVGDADLSA